MDEPFITAAIQFANPGGKPLYLDIHYPAGAHTINGGGLLPVVLGVPGGGWRESSREHVPLQLVNHGFAMVCLEYRVSQDAIAPANILDCKAALRWLQANATRHGLDPEAICVYGASAGGHLAALLGLSAGATELEEDGAEAAPAGTAIKAVCAVCGPSDLTRIDAPENRENFPLLYEVTQQYLGGPVAERTDLARLVSPLTYVAPGAPSMLLVHGSADKTVPLEESTTLHEALKAAGAKSELVVMKDRGHEWFAEETTPHIAAFFKAALAAH